MHGGYAKPRPPLRRNLIEQAAFPHPSPPKKRGGKGPLHRSRPGARLVEVAKPITGPAPESVGTLLGIAEANIKEA